MMTTQEFRPVNANEKSGVNNIQSCYEEIKKLKTQVNPKDHQCIAMGEFIIFEGDYHPDGIVNYKTPHKEVNYEIDKFPEEYQVEVQKLQKELNLTKKEVNELHKTVKAFDNKIIDLDEKFELLTYKAKQMKNENNMQKQLDHFYKSYSKFSECLTSDLASYDSETKNKIKKELFKLIHLIEKLIEKYLN